MAIRGLYNPATNNIVLDMESHLFDDIAPVTFHEMMHYYLKFTNFGSVHAMLCEINSKKEHLKSEPIETLQKSIKKLHEAMYLPQEGLAHVMQVRSIYEKEGMAGVKKLEDSIPNRPKEALSYCRDFVKFPKERFNKFTGKISNLAINTKVVDDLAQDSSLITDQGKLETYLREGDNSPNQRYQKLCRSIELNPEILDLSEEEICKKAGISYTPQMANAPRANLANTLTAIFTNNPSSLTEENIRVLDGDEMFTEAYKSIIITDPNIHNNAKKNLLTHEIYSELSYFRTVFIYNNPESPEVKQGLPFYSFSRNKLIIASVFTNPTAAAEKLNQDHTTKVIDTHSFDYTANALKPERAMLKPNVVWYKNFFDLEVLLKMISEKGIATSLHVIQWTEKHQFFYYLLRTEDQELLHIFPGFGFAYEKIMENPFIVREPDISKVTNNNFRHINNFYHDILGLSHFLDVAEMAKDAKAHLKKATMARDHGMGRNELCVCGSRMKFKKCHGR